MRTLAVAATFVIVMLTGGPLAAEDAGEELAAILVAALLGSTAQAATPESAHATTLPASMIGAWGWEAQSCANAGDDGRVVVRARSVAFFASTYTLKTIVVRPGGITASNAPGGKTSQAGMPCACRYGGAEVGPDR